mmetsp:Transcript_88839/g.172041  ORF Transcript_88839/g.172041 Transcript_88839/m.172041 type:complete len:220 (-) Transcript_88839:106-765(-)
MGGGSNKIGGLCFQRADARACKAAMAASSSSSAAAAAGSTGVSSAAAAAATAGVEDAANGMSGTTSSSILSTSADASSSTSSPIPSSKASFIISSTSPALIISRCNSCISADIFPTFMSSLRDFMTSALLPIALDTFNIDACVASWFWSVDIVARVIYIFSFARLLCTIDFAVIIIAFLSLDASFWHSAICFFSSRSSAFISRSIWRTSFFTPFCHSFI